MNRGKRFPGRDERTGLSMRLVLIIALIVGLIAAIYCCIKRRGTICKKRQAGAALEQDSIHSLDMTPQKVAVQADTCAGLDDGNDGRDSIRRD